MSDVHHRIHLNRDLIAGVVFVAFGVAGLWFGRDDPRGTALRMGPGYMPMLLSWALVVLGAGISLKGLVTIGEPLERWQIRPLALILAGILAFALLIEPMGLAIATLIIVVLGAAGGLEFRLGEAIALAVGLAVGAVLLFAYGLKLSIPIWPS